MKAILMLDGWAKEIELTREQYNLGIVECNIFPPLSGIPVSIEDGSQDITIVRAKFYHRGKTKNKMPIFEEE